MNMTPKNLLQAAAQTFYQGQQFKASAIVYGEMATTVKDDPEVWCGLGVGIANGVEGPSRERFLKAAMGAFHRCDTVAEGTPFIEIADNWKHVLNKANPDLPTDPLKDEELPELLDALCQPPGQLVQAVEKLNAEDQGTVVMGLGESGAKRFLDVILAAISGQWGDFNVRAALKRVAKFEVTPEVRRTLRELAATPEAELYEPYLGWALERTGTQPPEQQQPVSDVGVTGLPKDEAPEEDPGNPPHTPASKSWWKFW